MSQAQTLAAGLSPYEGFRNKIINGDMRIDQRNNGVVFVGASYCADRWSTSITTTGGTVSQQTGVTGPNLKFPRALTVTNTVSAVTSITEYVSRQPFELQMIRDLAGQKVAVSFWYKSNRTGLHIVRVIGGGVSTTGSNIDNTYTFPVNAANTWEFKTITAISFVGITGQGATLETDIGGYLDIGYRNTQGGATATLAVGDYFSFTGVQLEIGTAATIFDRRPLTTELQLCQRYYQKHVGLMVTGYALAGNGTFTDFLLPVAMRVPPTVTFSNFSNSNSSNATQNYTSTTHVRGGIVATATGAAYSAADTELYAEL
jgi:hypothetical protein